MSLDRVGDDKIAVLQCAEKKLSRRGFIRALAGSTLAAAALPTVASAKMLGSRSMSYAKELSFHNTHTGENLALAYYEQGSYLSDALQDVNHVMRDHRTDEVEAIDPALLDQLYDLKMILGADKPFHIISGYRSPHSNAKLSKNSRGVAKKSFHMQGRAIDIRVPGVSTRTLRNAAVSLRKGGVGYYPRSGFVHLDTGDVRTWS